MTPASSQVRMRWQPLSVSWGRLGHCTCTSLAGSNSTSTGFVDVEEAAATSAVVPAKLSVLAFDAMVRCCCSCGVGRSIDFGDVCHSYFGP